MVKIKVSYKHESELFRVKRALEPMVKSVKVAKSPKGEYRKAI